jgi:putative lipoprotein
MLAALKLTQAVALSAMLVPTGTAMAEPATIEGEASCRERIALRSGAVLEVELVDISRADAPAERLASIRVKAPGQVPTPCALYYGPALIKQNRTCAVIAKLTERPASIRRWAKSAAIGSRMAF